MKAPARRHSRVGRRRHWAASVAIFAAAMWAGAAKAEGGELFLRLGVANEAALLHHPAAQYQTGGSWMYVPRFGLTATYGVTHWLSLGIGTDVSLPRDVSAHDVVIQGLPPGTLAASYLAVMVPVRVGVSLGQGKDWSAEIAVTGGPAFSRWSADEMHSASGVRMPLEPFESWYTEWFGRLAVLAEWRPADWGSISFGPYVGASTARDLYVGGVIEGALTWGVGPFAKRS